MLDFRASVSTNSSYFLFRHVTQVKFSFLHSAIQRFAYLARKTNFFKKYPSLLRSPALTVIQCDSAALFTDIKIIQKNINRNTNGSRTFAVFRTRLYGIRHCPTEESVRSVARRSA